MNAKALVLAYFAAAWQSRTIDHRLSTRTGISAPVEVRAAGIRLCFRLSFRLCFEGLATSGFTETSPSF